MPATVDGNFGDGFPNNDDVNEVLQRLMHETGVLLSITVHYMQGDHLHVSWDFDDRAPAPDVQVVVDALRRAADELEHDDDE